jgi:16S rRNA U516 pseudouridylate synthase RsuA-like enzyme
MLDTVGHPVVRLRRERVGPLRLGRLAAGEWRPLRAAEVARLRRAAGFGEAAADGPAARG